ncbi:uncharacterized protein M6B38_303390 [Iris pallida]|uniref:SWIM-type domain-containing protein n=1 Tax=Iris pallida TaxID=29817 RepID=A0AAX6HLY7_IRIPA|nr:uncharacterized protein M6B38_303390 [Iris pallida]
MLNRTDQGLLKKTVIRVVLDDSVAPVAITPTIDNNTQERMILDNIDEANEANLQVGISLDTADDIGSQLTTNHFDTCITDVGQEFENVRAFRDELCKYAFAKGFSFKYIKNEKLRVTVKCISEDCPWRLHASRSTRKQKFIVKKINNVHTCGAQSSEDTHRRARKLWLAGTVRKQVFDNPDCRPRDIARNVYEEFGVHLSYSQAWTAKEIAQKEIHMLQEEACNQLPWLCEQIMGANPGSVATLATSVDAKFRRCFISFYASLHGFENGCRPLIFLDKICLTVNNFWKLLVAASVDGENEIFPVAFAIVEEETPDSWHWFLLQLKYAITSQRVTIVSSRQKGLDECVPQVFEDCYHGYSLLHLIEDFKAVLKKGPWSDQQKGSMVDSLKGAALAYLVEDFNSYIEKINDISKDVGKWVMSTKPDSWSNALFRGGRYDHFSSDIINSLSDWITIKDESSAVEIMNALLVKMMDMIDSRQQASSTWEDTLTPSMEKRLQKEMSRARSLNVICSTETVFEVRCSTVNVVDIGNWECTCKRWQISGLPCMHAIAVFDRIGRSVYDYCSKYLTRESYAVTYSTPIRPIPDFNLMKFIIPSSSYPPPSNRPPERPRRKRINPYKTSTRPLRCSRCRVVGHNKATCDVHL